MTSFFGILYWSAVLVVLLPAGRCQQGRSASVLPWNRQVDTRNNWRPVVGHGGASSWSPGDVYRPSQRVRRVFYQPETVEDTGVVYSDGAAGTRYETQATVPEYSTSYWSSSMHSGSGDGVTESPEGGIEQPQQAMVLGQSFYHEIARKRTTTTSSTTTITTTRSTTVKPTTIPPTRVVGSSSRKNNDSNKNKNRRNRNKNKKNKASPKPAITTVRSVREPAATPSIFQQLLASQAGGSEGSSTGSQLTSILGALLGQPASGSASNGDNPFAALLRRPTTTTTTTTTTTQATTTRSSDDDEANSSGTARPASFLSSLLGILTRPRPSRRPATTTTTTSTTTTTTPDEEVQQFDAGFQMFSQMFGGNGLDLPESSQLIGRPSKPSKTTKKPRKNNKKTTERPRSPTRQSLTTTTITDIPQTEPSSSTYSYYNDQQRPYQRPYYGPNQIPYRRRPSFASEKFDSNRPPPRYPLPYYYNTEVSTTERPKINLNQVFGSVVHLIRNDGPNMMSSMSNAVSLVREGDYLGVVQTIMPVLSQATPVLMNVINAMAPVLERGQDNSLGGFLDGAVSGRRPQKTFAEKDDSGVDMSYYIGSVLGSGLKLATYVIRFGTAVIHDRSFGDGRAFGEQLEDNFGAQLEWLRHSVGRDNLLFLGEWLQEHAPHLLRR